VDPGALDFEGQVRTFAGASVVLGVHGAGLTNVIWSGPDASVIELIPELIEDAGYRFMCNLLGTRHEALICRQMDSPLGPAFADIEVNCDALRSLLIRAA
jgi:capsular polysaccharide biosynthesis protein